MYCSSCGAAVEKGLSYCNRCGARQHRTVVGWRVRSQQSDDEEDGTSRSSTRVESLIWAIVAIFVVGMGCTIGLLAVMKNVLNFDTGLNMIFGGLSFLLMFILEAVFIWLLLRSARPRERALEAHQTGELDGLKQKALSPPAVGVTEHTTRTFEPTYAEQKPE